MEEFRVISKAKTEIVFASRTDMSQFYDDFVIGAKPIVISYVDHEVQPPILRSEVMQPINYAMDISEGKILLRSEEKQFDVKRKE